MSNTTNKKSDLLELRTSYADALNKSVEIFISHTEKAFDDVMSRGLRPVADAADLDRIIIFRVFDEKNNTAGEIYRWDKALGGTAPANPALKVLPLTSAIKRWVSVMSNDTCISLRRSEFREDEAAFLIPHGVQSILIVPVFVEGKFWGIVSFQDNTNERDFDENCTGLLRSTARLCTGTIIRDEKTQVAETAIENLKRRTEMADTLNKTALLFLSQSDKPFEEVMTVGIKPIVDLLEIDRFSIFRNFSMPDGLHASQIYRWDRASGGYTPPNSAFADVTFAKNAPNWEPLLAQGKSVNSPVRLMPGRESAMLKAMGTVSAFVTPVFINDTYWGFAFFEDHRNERYFSDDYAEMIRLTVFLCANTVIRSEMEHKILESESLKQARETDERTRIMLEATPLACQLWNKDFKIFECNDETVKLFKVKDKQEYMDRHLDFSPEYQPDGQHSRDAARKILEKVFAEGRHVFEWLHRNAVGELIPCETALVRVKYKDDYIIAGYTRDLRELKAAMAKTREADERTRIIFDTAPIACCMFDKDFNIFDCNQETVRMFELPNKQVYLEKFFDLSPEYQTCGKRSGEMAAEQNKKTFREGYNRFEWMHRTLNGNPIPCEIIQMRVRFKDEYVIACYIRDLREHKALLNEIHSENEKYKAMSHWYESILEAIPFAVISQDLNKTCTFINTVAETSLGKKRAEIIGKSCRNFGLSICDTDNCAVNCAKCGRMRTHFFHNNDSYQVDTKLMKDLDGNNTGYIEVIQDITKMEHLAKQQAEAEAANNAKTSFLSAMSHEMRTPMNAIIGMASIGRKAKDLERKDYALDKIEDASMHLLGVINDVLDMSKIEANKLELSYVTFDLRNLLKKMVSLIQFSMEQKQLRFSMNVAENTPSFFIGDDQRLTQILINLLSNAIKFTPNEGSVNLDVSLAGEENKICELRFEVADSGIGIAAEQQEKIFHPFEQAESGTTRKYGGTGLGLVITKNLIELMGGVISVESDIGKGARFIFTAKLPRIEDMPQSGFNKNKISMEEIFDKFKGRKLLLVEDIEINREIFISILDGSGLLIDIAENGKKALDMVRAAPDKYDAIFMDMQMPEMDGLEATRQIRAFELERSSNSKEFAPQTPAPVKRPKGIPIIAMTANVFQEDIERCHAAGMDDHIGKPLILSKLLEKLSEYLTTNKA